MSLVVRARTVTRYNHFLWKQNNSISFPLGLLIIDDDRPWARPDLVRSTWLMGEVELSDGYILISGRYLKYFNDFMEAAGADAHPDFERRVSTIAFAPLQSQKI